MKLLSPTPQKRFNELFGLLLLSLGLVVLLSLASYHFQDPSGNTVAAARPANLIGYPGAWLSDLLLQGFGIAAFLFPAFLFGLAWKWVRSEEVEAGAIKLCGMALLLLSLAAVVSFAPRLTLFASAIPLGGVLGLVLAHYLMRALNPTGAILLTITMLIVSVYLVSTFTMSKLAVWFAGPLSYLRAVREAWQGWRQQRRKWSEEKARIRAAQKAEKRRRAAPAPELASAPTEDNAPPFDIVDETPAAREDIPICPLDEAPPTPAPAYEPVPLPVPGPVLVQNTRPSAPTPYRLPSTDLLNEGQGRSPYDEQEL